MGSVQDVPIYDGQSPSVRKLLRRTRRRVINAQPLNGDLWLQRSIGSIHIGVAIVQKLPTDTVAKAGILTTLLQRAAHVILDDIQILCQASLAYIKPSPASEPLPADQQAGAITSAYGICI